MESIPSRHGPASTLQPQKYQKSQQSFQARQARPPCQYLHFHRSSPCLPWSWGKHEASQIESWNVCTRVAVCRQIHHFCILRRKTAKDTWHLRSASSQAVCSFYGLSCFLSGVQEATSAAAIGCDSKPRAIEALEKALQPACWFHCDFTAFQNRCSQNPDLSRTKTNNFGVCTCAFPVEDPWYSPAGCHCGWLQCYLSMMCTAEFSGLRAAQHGEVAWSGGPEWLSHLVDRQLTAPGFWYSYS